MAAPRQAFCQAGHDMSVTRQGSGRTAYCSECRKQRGRTRYLNDPEYHHKATRAWASRHPDRKWASRIKCLYGVTPEQINAQKRYQNDCCAVCGREFTDQRKPYVDHNHRTEVFRGLLCQKCNCLLGFAEENITVLQAAITYLVGHGE